MNYQKAFLIILDGWGLGQELESDAIRQAQTPFFDRLLDTYPNARLTTHGTKVGLPDGQMGNSEVGHLNIGAGRIVFQELLRINNDLDSGGLGKNRVMSSVIDRCKASSNRIHLLGLVSDGGVHSHIDHLKHLVKFISDKQIGKIFIHAFTDGRDTDPESGIGFIREVLDLCSRTNAQLSSVVGRYYAMDRDKRWERVKLAYDLLVNGVGEVSQDVLKTIRERYSDGETDEFLKPIWVGSNKDGCIKDGDSVLFFNFRTDRPRQLTEALSQKDFPEYGMHSLNVDMVTMTPYDPNYKGIDVLYDKQLVYDTIGEIISKLGLSQVRIAETEKYPHVTYFFSGGKEEALKGEKRILVDSPKVATYDLQPEMSALSVTEKLLQEISENEPDFICLNFANADMVGHTGLFSAAIKAVETVDHCLAQLVERALEHHYQIVVIADHGNADYMVNADGSPNTAHTINPVPIIYISTNTADMQIEDGILADVAPTLLDLMNIEIPDVMTGHSLLSKSKEKV
jgi:2,3-bisphosphoglycerate-independent phosphoglycerate mutase